MFSHMLYLPVETIIILTFYEESSKSMTAILEHLKVDGNVYIVDRNKFVKYDLSP